MYACIAAGWEGWKGSFAKEGQAHRQNMRSINAVAVIILVLYTMQTKHLQCGCEVGEQIE